MSLALRFSTFRLYTGLEVVAVFTELDAIVARAARAARRGERRRGVVFMECNGFVTTPPLRQSGFQFFSLTCFRFLTLPF